MSRVLEVEEKWRGVEEKGKTFSITLFSECEWNGRNCLLGSETEGDREKEKESGRSVRSSASQGEGGEGGTKEPMQERTGPSHGVCYWVIEWEQGQGGVCFVCLFELYKKHRVCRNGSCRLRGSTKQTETVGQMEKRWLGKRARKEDGRRKRVKERTRQCER